MQNKTGVDFQQEKNTTKPYLVDFKSLSMEIKRRGLYGRDTRKVCLEFIAHILITIVGIALFITFDNIFSRVISALIMTSGLLGIGTHTHNSSHYGSTEKKSIDDFLTSLGYSTLLGFSGVFWKHKHCIVHHGNPNIIGVDEDIDLMPFFAVTETDIENASKLGQFYHRNIQPIIFPFMISLTAFNIQRQAWLFLIRALLNNKRRKTLHWVDLGYNILHIIIWLVLPLLFFSPTAVIEFYILRNVLIGYALFFMLGSSHLPNEALCSAEHQQHQEFSLKQIAGTINIKTNRYGRFIMSGLDYQIDHHLFRGISYTRLPEVSELVQEYCEYHNYPYHTLGFFEASWKTIMVFYKPKPVHTDLLKAVTVNG
ncbi:MAG: fatty acid desaturase [Methylococcales bacterium]